MTEYDVHKLHQKILEKERISYLHANEGVIEIGYADGTKEIYKRSKWKNKFKLIRKRK